VNKERRRREWELYGTGRRSEVGESAGGGNVESPTRDIGRNLKTYMVTNRERGGKCEDNDTDMIRSQIGGLEQVVRGVFDSCRCGGRWGG